MSLVISTGTNLGNRKENLDEAKNLLSHQFDLLEESRIYSSPAVDYLDQPDFLNQILVFKIPKLTPLETIDFTLALETKLGRQRNIARGPRTIDIDILFWNLDEINHPKLQVPHPRLFERSFIVLPLQELEVFSKLSERFQFPTNFSNTASPL